MTVEFSPFKSSSGFSSPNFLVSPQGDLTLNSSATFNNIVTIAGTLEVNNISFNSLGNSFSLIDSDDSVVSLSSQIKNSSLTNLGVLEKLEVDGDVYIGISSTSFIVIDNGIVTILSDQVGSIDNIEIGLNSAANANFKDVNIGSISEPAVLTVIGTASITTASITTVNSTTVNSTTVNSTTVNADNIDVDDITINNTPTEIYHATRKDYVDNRITALSIALGS